jgi:3-oxoacyl-[acyl-carrier-protein] synthase-3
MGAAITGWGTALPSNELSNAELARRLEVSEQWIFERTGILSRWVAGDEDTASSLSAAAGAAALERARVDPEDLDMVIVATTTPDYQMPATAPLVQAALGATRAGAFDVGAACAGFLYGLAQANALVASGAARRVLVCGADLLTRVSDYSDRGSSVLFGDGAGAVIVEDVPGDSRFGSFSLKSDGSQARMLYIPRTEKYVRMRGREVYRRAVESMTLSVREVVAAAGLRIEDVDLLVAHQANARILEAVVERLGLPPERALINIVRLGNTSAASIPLALAEAVEEGKLREDDLVVLTAFGSGFVWGAGVVRWGTGVREQADLAFAGQARA